MSRHEWEEGTIKVPHEAWPDLRTAIIMSYNRFVVERQKLAAAAFKAASAAGKGKRGFSRADWVWNHEQYGRVAHFITKRDETGRLKRGVYTPKKRDFRALPTSRSARIELLDGVTIILDNKSRTVFYSVPENNHACERARNHKVVQALFTNLRRVHWTRGSGGEIYGNDEYNQDNKGFDGGTNYVTERFGPNEGHKRFNGMFFTEGYSRRPW